VNTVLAIFAVKEGYSVPEAIDSLWEAALNTYEADREVKYMPLCPVECSFLQWVIKDGWRLGPMPKCAANPAGLVELAFVVECDDDVQSVFVGINNDILSNYAESEAEEHGIVVMGVAVVDARMADLEAIARRAFAARRLDFVRDADGD
jgi:hypothetical protein